MNDEIDEKYNLKYRNNKSSAIGLSNDSIDWCATKMYSQNAIFDEICLHSINDQTSPFSYMLKCIY